MTQPSIKILAEACKVAKQSFKETETMVSVAMFANISPLIAFNVALHSFIVVLITVFAIMNDCISTLNPIKLTMHAYNSAKNMVFVTHARLQRRFEHHQHIIAVDTLHFQHNTLIF